MQIGWIVKADNTRKSTGVTIEEDALKAYKTLDFSLPVGISYEYEKVFSMYVIISARLISERLTTSSVAGIIMTNIIMSETAVCC